MKVKVKEGVGIISNADMTYKEGKVYNIPDNKFNSEIFEELEDSKPKKTNKKRGKR